MSKRIIAVTMAFLVALMCFCIPVYASVTDSKKEKDAASEKPITDSKAAKSGDVRKVEVNTPTATVRVNQNRTLWALITPANANDTNVYWDTSNPEIVVIDDDGVMTGISPGTAVITVTTENGKTDTCTVTVPGTVLTGIMEDQKNSDRPEAEISAGETLSAATLRLEVERMVKDTPKGETPTVILRDKSTVSTAALRAAAFTAEYSGREVLLRFVTPGAGNGQAQGQISFDPRNASKEDFDIKVGVHTSPEYTQTIKEAVQTTFGNNAAVVRLAHSGGYGMTVRVAAKVDLSALDTGALRLYSYNTANGSYALLKDQSYTLDTDLGYVFFSTDQGGTVILSDKQLK